MEDLQSLLEKINRDGVEKAEAEAKKIVDAAQAKADALVKKALEEAAQAKADADKAAQVSSERAAETIRQAARDIVIGVKGTLTALLEKLLVQDVDKALADEKTAAGLAATAIGEMTSPGEITCSAKLAAALKAQLAGKGSFAVTADDAVGNGFTVKLDGGRIEHTFTTEAITDELAKRLRPDLAALLK